MNFKSRLGVSKMGVAFLLGTLAGTLILSGTLAASSVHPGLTQELAKAQMPCQLGPNGEVFCPDPDPDPPFPDDPLPFWI